MKKMRLLKIFITLFLLTGCQITLQIKTNDLGLCSSSSYLTSINSITEINSENTDNSISMLTQENLNIQGDSILTEEQLVRFATSRNSEINPQIISNFYEISKRYNIRGDLAFIQSCLETNFYLFGGEVLPSQNNFGGLGATGPGVPGLSFDSIEQGVLANIQHLYAYASIEALPLGEELIDPRFKYVSRGSALTYDDLAGKWASDPDYGEKISHLFDVAQSF